MVSPPQSVEQRLASTGRFAPGQVIAGRFTVVRYIARGGMGEVYEVEDSFLQGVHVALKMILPEIAGDVGSSGRFEQEVLLARKVTHPNLCPIYDIARCDNTPPPFLFLTMKLLSGETLSWRLRKPGLIPREEAIAIFTQVVAGVAAIHSAGVIHRDIKPNNVMLDYSGPELRLSIMDFGLARLHEPEETMGTRSLIAGTPGYLAPEVLRGEGPSQATDLFALGVLLHQVLTGDRPHFGPLSLSVELSPALVTADVSPAIIDATKEFLSSDPKRRCVAFAKAQSSVASGTQYHVPAIANGTIPWMHQRLIRIGAGILSVVLLLAGVLFIPAIRDRARGILLSSKEKHIAVLPLESVGDTPETQAIGDGLMDSLAGRLSNLGVANNALWVIPASEVRARKVTDSSSALREFGATMVVRGRFEKTSKSAHLQLFLIDSKDMRQIGYVDSETQTGDLATLEDQAITSLGRLLNLSLPVDLSRKTEQPSTRAAYEDYLAGTGYFQRKDKPGNLDRAISALENATKTDPHFALAFARLAQVYIVKYKLTSDSQWLKLAEEYSRQAAELDDRVPSTYVALAQIHDLTGNHDLAIQEYERALVLDSRDADALSGLARSLRNEGRNSEAEATYIKAASIRPDDWSGYNSLGNFYQNTGHPHEAIEQFRHALRLTPDNSWPYINLALAYEDLDDPKMLGSAETALKKSISINPSFVAYADLAFLYLQQHRFTESVSASKEALRLNDRSADAWANLTLAYEWLKEEDKANAARAKAIQLFEEGVRQDPQDAVAHANLAALYAKEGKNEKVAESIRISLALSPRSRYVLSQVADAYELGGNRQESIRYLGQAFAEGVTMGQLNADPEIQGVLSDPRFLGLSKAASSSGFDIHKIR
jgi:eukaryotic-like serine/threonine-protein kinase